MSHKLQIFNKKIELNIENRIQIKKRKLKFVELKNLKRVSSSKFIKPAYTVKYIGDLEGSLGIGTKKIFNKNDDFVDHNFMRNIGTAKSRTKPMSHIFESTSNSRNFDEENFMLKDFPKQNLKDGKDSDTDSLLKKSFQSFIKTKFTLPSSKTRYNPVISNTDYFQVLHFKRTEDEVKNESKSHRTTLTAKRRQNSEIVEKMPSLFKNMHSKKKTKSDSENLFPNRYSKPEINFKEYLTIHNAHKRKFPKGIKLIDHNIRSATKTKNKNSAIVIN